MSESLRFIGGLCRSFFLCQSPGKSTETLKRGKYILNWLVSKKQNKTGSYLNAI